jgi:hypothetical protein
MSNPKQTKDGIIPLLEEQSLEVMKLRQEHEKDTIWRKEMFKTYATCVALLTSAIGGTLALCLVVYYKDRETLAIIAPIISGVLAFVAAKFC